MFNTQCKETKVVWLYLNENSVKRFPMKNFVSHLDGKLVRARIIIHSSPLSDIAFRVINYSELFQIAGIDTCKQKNTSHGLCENLLVLKEKRTPQSRKQKS